MMFPYGLSAGSVGGEGETIYVSGSFMIEFCENSFEVLVETPAFTIEFCECK